ncbi:MAG: hypothetical protein KKA73_06580 [Chloroflexi bacterium]|nr:hypothetical protein [Chloroflexota bacterium]MBU1747337.1 hypothetical protein [Chloroflexota bacterium]
MPNALIVHPLAQFRTHLAEALTLAPDSVAEQAEVWVALSLLEALDLAGRVPLDLVVTAEVLADGTGGDLSRRLKERGDAAPVILLTQDGAVAYVPEPAALDQVPALARQFLAPAIPYPQEAP